MAFVLPSPVLHSTPRCQSVHRCKHQKSLNIGRIRCSSTNSNEGSSTQGSSSSDLKTIDSVEDRSNGVPPPSTQTENVLERRSSGQRRQADSTDWVASQLTRRFGIAGGLAWLGILTVGVVGEQIKTRLEEQAEIDGTKEVEGEEVVLANGLRYKDIRIGGGLPPSPGYLVLVNYRGEADGVVYEDTWERGKPIVFLFGSRPFAGGMCAGMETALSSMNAGGLRRVTIPPQLGFGDAGAVLRPTEHVPDKQGVIPRAATLDVLLELKRVSIPPT